MGVCGCGSENQRNRQKKEVAQAERLINNNQDKDSIIPEKNKLINKEEDIKMRNIPENLLNSIKTFNVKYHYILKDTSKNETYKDIIKSDSKIYDLLSNINLRAIGDFIIKFKNNKEIGYDKINEKFNNIIEEVFNKDIPETIEMEYTFKGLDIPLNLNNIIDAYAESNEIIGSAILDNPDLFTIITYDKKMNSIKTYNYKRKENEDLIKFNLFTAFCNGKGKLYFSGGEYEEESDLYKTTIKYNDFFYIDLSQLNENKIEIKELPNMNESRTWHSMIYIPDKYIFIVGGSNTKSVEIYNIETNDINKDSELNEFRSECTLCLVNNIYLYAFCGFLINQDYISTIERCDLLKEERKWEYANINEKDGFIFRPSFFGVSYFKDEQILLIGGDDNGNEKYFDYIYKIGKNEEEADEIEEFKFDLRKEKNIFRDKLFMPIGENKSVIIPLAIGEDIKVYELDTNTGEITIKYYKDLII